jgi:hypothetical protein
VLHQLPRKGLDVCPRGQVAHPDDNVDKVNNKEGQRVRVGERCREEGGSVISQWMHASKEDTRSRFFGAHKNYGKAATTKGRSEQPTAISYFAQLPTHWQQPKNGVGKSASLDTDIPERVGERASGCDGGCGVRERATHLMV